MKHLKRHTIPMLIASLFAVAPRAGVALELSAEDHAKLAEPLKALYKAADGGKFKLDADIPDNTSLHNALKEERENVKKAKDEAKKILDRFKDVDPEKYKEMLSKLTDDEEATLIKAGKMEDVINKRIEKLKTKLEGERDAALEATKKALERVKLFEGKVLDNSVREAAVKAGLHANAIDDALLHARTTFRISEDGSVVQLGEDGKPVLGTDGKTPFTPGEWMEGRKKSSPHWFPASGSGSGASGSGDKSGGKTLTRSQYDAMSPADRHKAVSVDKYTIVD